MAGFDRSHGFVILVLVVTACSESPQANGSAHVATRAPTVPAAISVIEVRPLTISFQGQVIARLFADGRTESAGPNAPGTGLVPGPTIHADGTITMTKGGVTARIDDQGDLYVAGSPDPHSRELFGHISEDRFTFARSPRPWDVRVQGNLVEFGEHNSSQIDGNVTASMRHTVLVMAAAFYIEGALTPP